MVSDRKQTDSHPEAEQIPLYVLGTLNPLEREALEQHLMGCADCQRELEEEKLLQPAVQEALENRPEPSVRVLQRVQEIIAQRADQTARRDVYATDASPGWITKVEQWIRQLFLPRWVPASALLLILIQGAFLQHLLLSPATTRVPGMEGPLLEREISMPPGASSHERTLRVTFSSDISLQALESVLSLVQGKIVNGPLEGGAYLVEVPYSDLQDLQDKMTELSESEHVHHVSE